MNFYTSVQIPDDLPRFCQADELLMMGSCFAGNIGRLLVDAKFRCDVNPFGVLYNPLSVSAALREIVLGKVYDESDLFFYREFWHSPMHHGDFSAEESAVALEQINTRLNFAHKQMSSLKVLLITFGTAWIYAEKETGRVVGNCHKQPDSSFIRRKLSVDEIVDDYVGLLKNLFAGNSHLKVMFTISPIRHLRDGMHQNQLSKATLLLAVDRLRELFCGRVSYFPAYEIVIDELRDYRFYAEDMAHPSLVTVQYIWDKFVQSCLSEEALQIMEESENIRKALVHKPFHPESEEYKSFLGQIVLKMERLNKKYPYLDFQKERDLCHIRLNQ